jgi:hypothetical protein
MSGGAKKLITVDGHAFKVTQNLYKALHNLLSRDHVVRLLWIDAICINQRDDVVERNNQVRLMRHIYSGATSVIAYLGDPYPGLSEGICFLRLAAEGQQSLIKRLQQSPDFNPGQLCSAVISFFNRPGDTRCSRLRLLPSWYIESPLVSG